jgi:hypothetical protein
VYLELRADDGTGKPGATVLATSDYLPAGDISTTEDTYYFYFFDHYRIPTTGVYHICLQADTQSVSAVNYVGFQADSSGVYADGQMCYGNSVDSWTAVPSQDCWFDIMGMRLDVQLASNLSVLHPYDNLATVNFSELFDPIVKVGVSLSMTDLDVKIERRPVFTLLNDQTTEINITGTTPTYVTLGELLPTGVERVVVLYKQRTSNASYVAYAKPVLGSILNLGSVATTNNLNYGADLIKSHTFTTPKGGHYRLGFQLYSQNAGVTSYVGRVIVLGA